MSGRRWGAFGALLAATGLIAASIHKPAQTQPLPAVAARVGRPGLSVMVYNVEGLPWPIRFGRSAAFEQIEARLRAMRDKGEQPHVVALQEAFAEDARAIGARAGYRYVVDGPAADAPGAPPIGRNDQDFEASRSFWRGETSGKLLGSGLQILSDYPVLAVRRQPFPQAACAGFDCLANKGMVMAMIAVPGQPTPVAVVDLHLNSRKAAHVRSSRSIIAYRAQIDAVAAFLRANVPEGVPVVVAGDFNMGRNPQRVATLAARLAPWMGGIDHNAFGFCIADGNCRRRLSADAFRSIHSARDFQFLRAGASARLVPERISTPFGHEPDGGMLSDHVGYMVSYRVAPRA